MSLPDFFMRPDIDADNLSVDSLSGSDIIVGDFTTQSTSITTSVTLNTKAGGITTQTATNAINTSVSFTVNNNQITSSNRVMINFTNYTGGLLGVNGLPTVTVGNISDGSFDIVITNGGNAALSGTFVVVFFVI